MSSPATRNVALDRIQIDPSLQARTELDADTVTRYEATLRQSIEDGVAWPFPPLVSVFDLLVDGFHRFEAAKRVGIASIPVTIHSGDREDAIRLAVGANATHGLARSREDVKRAILLASKTWPDESARSIARMVGCSPQTVLNVRERAAGVSNLDSHSKSSEPETRPLLNMEGDVIGEVPQSPFPELEEAMADMEIGSGLLSGDDPFEAVDIVIRTERGWFTFRSRGCEIIESAKEWGTAQIAMECMRRARWKDGAQHPPTPGRIDVIDNAANALKFRGEHFWDGLILDLDLLFETSH
jgi:hypothetical protein